MQLLLIAVLIFAQQPAESPKGEGVAEANRAKNTAYGKKAKTGQTQSAQPAPTPTPAPIATESQRIATTASNHAGTSSQYTDDEDRSTQRKLTWFTGILAGVGVLQLVVMFLTWRIYRRQAYEMRRQRHEMRRQRHVMFRQWKAMGEQAELMKGQLAAMKSSGEQTAKLIDHAKGQVNALLSSATAMQESIRFQRATLEQWVETVNWRVEHIPPIGEQPHYLHIRAEVVNPTNFPLTLERAHIYFNRSTRLLFADHCLLTPRNPYPLSVLITLSDEAWIRYWQQSPIMIPIDGDLSHIGSLRELRPQSLRGYLICAHRHPTRFEVETAAPEDQNPN